MRKSFLLALGFLLTTGILLAQGHDNSAEKKARTEIKLATDTKVGTTILKAGEYEVFCDKEKVTFVRVDDRKKFVQFACEGHQLTGTQPDTRMETVTDKDGVRVLETLRLGGSNVEHTFK